MLRQRRPPTRRIQAAAKQVRNTKCNLHKSPITTICMHYSRLPRILSEDEEESEEDDDDPASPNKKASAPEPAGDAAVAAVKQRMLLRGGRLLGQHNHHSFSEPDLTRLFLLGSPPISPRQALQKTPSPLPPPLPPEVKK